MGILLNILACSVGILVISFCLKEWLWMRRVAEAASWEESSQEKLTTWRMRNPGVYIGLSPQGTALVMDRINSHKNYLMVWNIKYDRDEFLDFLESLLNEFPDPSPNDVPVKEPQDGGSFFLCRESRSREYRRTSSADLV